MHKKSNKKIFYSIKKKKKNFLYYFRQISNRNRDIDSDISMPNGCKLNSIIKNILFKKYSLF